MADPENCIVLVDGRTLSRDTFTRVFALLFESLAVLAFETVEAWRRDAPFHDRPRLIVLAMRFELPNWEQDITALKAITPDVPIVLMSQGESPGQIFKALELGVKGYIPGHIGIDVAREALRLLMAGGMYVPVESFTSAGKLSSSEAALTPAHQRVFTDRQAAIVHALRQGKANKAIAYELSMRECTVKVHVRNIMRKLKARNRTEVAFKTDHLFPDDIEAPACASLVKLNGGRR